MSVKGVISKEEITQAFDSAYLIEFGEQRLNPILFLRKFGDIVLEQFSAVKLIGEIERQEGEKTYEELKNCMNKIGSIAIYSSENNRQARAVLSLYLVWSGIFTYGEEQGHEFWSHVFEGLSVSNDENLASMCGQWFIKCLEENDLERFEHIETPRKYVTRILLHGLIPEVHIGRFINELILPELSGEMSSYVTGRSVLNKWNREKRNVLQYLPKPIQNFVRFGQPVNSDVVNRFLEMASNWNVDDTTFWMQWGLPKYMVEAFRNCLTGARGPVIRKRPARYRFKPYIMFDLKKSDHPFLYIPPQDVNNKISVKVHSDRIEDSSEEDTVLAHSNEVPVCPAHKWVIDVCDQTDNILHKKEIDYQFPKAQCGEEIPLFLFDAGKFKLLQIDESTTVPREIIIVYPSPTFLVSKRAFYIR